MRVEKPAVDKVWTLSKPLWPDKHAMSVCLVPRKQLSEENPRREFAFVMSPPQHLTMNE
jgi:hypothetical protein